MNWLKPLPVIMTCFLISQVAEAAKNHTIPGLQDATIESCNQAKPRAVAEDLLRLAALGEAQGNGIGLIACENEISRRDFHYSWGPEALNSNVHFRKGRDRDCKTSGRICLSDQDKFEIVGEPQPVIVDGINTLRYRAQYKLTLVAKSEVITGSFDFFVNRLSQEPNMRSLYELQIEELGCGSFETNPTKPFILNRCWSR